MALKYNYVGEETPVERLRNKLQPLFFIVEQLHAGEDLTSFGAVIKSANDNLDEIRDHLSDVKEFYATIPKIKYTQNNSLEIDGDN